MAVQKTSVSILQELMQRNQKPLPTYSSSDADDLKGNFTCVVLVDGVETVGYGKTKKEAKHNSAKNAIAILQKTGTNSLMKTTDVLVVPKTVSFAGLPTENYIGALNEFCSKNSLPYPEYKENGFNGQDFYTICSLNEVNGVGKGINKKIAKQEAARVVLEKIKVSDFWKNKITVDKLQKLACDENTVKKIAEVFSNLTAMEKKYIPQELKISTEIDFSNCDLKQLQNLPLKQEDYPPMEKSEEKLRNMGIKDYSISVFIKEPLMLIFKTKEVIPGTFTLIQDGATYTEIKKNLLATAVRFIHILKS